MSQSFPSRDSHRPEYHDRGRKGGQLTSLFQDAIDVGAIPDAERDRVLVKGVVGKVGEVFGVAEVERDLGSCGGGVFVIQPMHGRSTILAVFVL